MSAIVPPAVDVSRWVAAPCSLVPAAVATQLGLAEKKAARGDVLPGAGEQAQCQLSSGPPLSAAAELRLYPKARPVPLVSGPGSTVKPVQVGGYPAGEWVLSTGEDGSFTSCHALVDLGPQQGLSALFNGPSGEPVSLTCAKAKTMALAAIAAARSAGH